MVLLQGNKGAIQPPPLTLNNKMIQKFETYGKQNLIIKECRNIKERFSPSHHTINLMRGFGLGVYTPKLNKARVSFASVGIVGCLVTPFTSWSIPFIVGWALK